MPEFRRPQCRFTTIHTANGPYVDLFGSRTVLVEFRKGRQPSTLGPEKVAKNRQRSCLVCLEHPIGALQRLGICGSRVLATDPLKAWESAHWRLERRKFESGPKERAGQREDLRCEECRRSVIRH